MDHPAKVYPGFVTEFDAGKVTNEPKFAFVVFGAVLPPAELNASA